MLKYYFKNGSFLSGNGAVVGLFVVDREFRYAWLCLVGQKQKFVMDVVAEN